MKRGSAHVKGLYTVPNGSGTQFGDGAQVIWDLGLRTLKFYLTADYLTDYPLQTSWSSVPTNLTQLAQTTQVSTVLAQNWETIILTVFTFSNGTTNWWRVSPSNAKYTAEYNEIYNLCVHLYTTYNGTGRKFILQNWEGDWAFGDSVDPTLNIDRKYVDYYVAFLGTRQRAVADARKNVGINSDVTIQNAIECNRVVDARYSDRRRIIKDIAEKLQPDIVSYSAYDSTIVDQGGWGANQAAWEAATRPVYAKALRAIKRAFPGVPVMIGEFGFPENEAPVGNDIAAMIQLVNDVSEEEQLIQLIFWEVFDNEPSIPYTYRGYWLRKPNGDLSISGAKFQALGP